VQIQLRRRDSNLRDTPPGMSQADIETLRAGYEAASRRDWDAALRTVHPDFELTTADRDPLAGTYRGHEDVTRIFEDMLEPFEEAVVEPQEFFERGDRIAVFVLARLRPMGSSATIEIRIGHLWTMRDGKAVRCEIFAQRERALEAAGLNE
jgi:uncharacterized protein